MIACSRPPPPTTRTFIGQPPCFRRRAAKRGQIRAPPRRGRAAFFLMVEQADAVERHHNAVFVAGFNDLLVPDGAARLHDVPSRRNGARARCCPQRGRMRREPRQTPVTLGQPFFFFRRASAVRDVSVKVSAHTPSPSTSIPFVGDIHVDGVVAVGAARRPRRNGRPSTFGCWRRCQMSALLPARRVQWMRLCWPAPTPMSLSALGVAHRVGLGVFQRDQAQSSGPASARRSAPCSRVTILENVSSPNLQLVAPLLKRDAEHILVLHGRGLVDRVDLRQCCNRPCALFSGWPARRRNSPAR